MSLRRLLVVTWGGVRDGVVCTSLLRPLRTLYPGCRIGLWTSPLFASFLDDQALIDDLHVSPAPFSAEDRHARDPSQKFMRVLRDVRQIKYDAALVSPLTLGRSLVFRLAGFRDIIALSSPRKGAPVSVDTFSRYARTISAWAGSFPDGWRWQPRIDLSFREQKWANGWRQELGWTEKKLLTIQPDSSDPSWSVGRYFELIRYLASKDNDLRFAVVAGRNVRPRVDAELTMTNRSYCQVIDAAPLVLKGLMGTSRLWLDTGSSWTALARAIGTPTVLLASDESAVPALFKSGRALFYAVPLPSSGDAVKITGNRILSILSAPVESAPPALTDARV